MNKRKINKLSNDEIMFNFREMLKNASKLDEAEKTLKKVLDLINSNEDLAYFVSTKKEIRKPIEDYFKGGKK